MTSKNKKSPVNIELEFNDRLSEFKAVLKKKCNLYISTQNAYDAMAVAQGIKDFQTAKGLTSPDLYTLRTNLGLDGEGFWVSRDLGLHQNKHDAILAAVKSLDNCDKFLTWHLFRNGKKTNNSFKSHPKLSGVHINIAVSGKNIFDVSSLVINTLDGITEDTVQIKSNSSDQKLLVDFNGQENNLVLSKRPHIEDSVFYAIVGMSGIYEKSPFRNLREDYDKIKPSDLKNDNIKFCYNIDLKKLKAKISEKDKSPLYVIPFRTKKINPFFGTPNDCIQYMNKHPKYRYILYSTNV